MKLLTHGQLTYAAGSMIGPACWPFHDLLVVLGGAIKLQAGQSIFELKSGDALLLTPGTKFAGHVTEDHTTVWVQHFSFAGKQSTALGSLLVQKSPILFVAGALAFPIRNLLERMEELMGPLRTASDTALCQHLLWAVLLELKRTRRPGPGVRHAEAIRQSCAWALRNLEKIHGVSCLAKRTGLSASRFSALFRSMHFISAGAWLSELRIAEACRLFRSTNLSVKEISHRVGYRRIEVFHRAFVRRRGTTPGTFRANNPPPI